MTADGNGVEDTVNHTPLMAGSSSAGRLKSMSTTQAHVEIAKL